MKRLCILQGLPWHWLLPLLFFLIGLIYIYASPHFEASDSIQHLGVIQWIAEKRELPVQSAYHGHLYGQEASQPPLYYLLTAPIWMLTDTSDFSDFIHRNPLVFIGEYTRLGNRNLVFYRQPYPPDLRGSSLTLYIIRVVTLAMGAATVAAVYQSARTIIPNNIGFAALAASLTAFNPMFIFTSASVSNDALVSMLTALIAWQMLAMLREGFQTRRSLVLATLIALASLAKLSGLALGLVVALVGIWLVIRSRDRRGFIVLGGAMLVAFLAIAGWWYLRNLMLYGELFGTNAMLDHFGRRPATLLEILTEDLEGLRITFWGLFGVFNILIDRIFYQAMDLLALASAVGLVVFVVKQRKSPIVIASIVFLGILLCIGMAMLVWWSLQSPATLGRLLFPYITSTSVLMALGLTALRLPPLMVALPLFAFSLVSPFAYIMPNYDHPPVVEQLPASAIQTTALWDDIKLVGYELPQQQRWSSGDEIPLTLYWQPLAQSTELLSLFLTLIDAEGEAMATIDTFPGWGTLPTMWWEPGKIYRDDYTLQIPEDAEGFSTTRLHIGWYPYPDGSNIQPVLESGEKSYATIIPIGAFIGANPQQTLGADATPDGTVFGDSIRLNGWRFSGGNVLELEWQLAREMAGDWRVFAIVLAEPYQPDTAIEILLQKDRSPPVPLDFVRTDETFLTRHDFELPDGFSGEYGIYIGWYNEDIGQRLEAPYPDNMLLLEDVGFYG